MQRVSRAAQLTFTCTIVFIYACSAGNDSSTGDVSDGEQEVSGCFAKVFEHCDFQGAAVCLPTGNIDRRKLSRLGMPNRSISSVKVNPGYRLQLFSQDYQEGTRKIFISDNSCLVNVDFNDQAVSARLTQSSTTGGSGGSGGASTSGGSGSTGGTTGGAGSGGTGSTGGASTSGGSGDSGGNTAGAAGTTGGDAWWKPAPGLAWQWNISGSIDTTKNVPVFDIDLFDAPQSAIDELHAKGRKVICYFSAGSSEDWRPDYGSFQASDLGSPLDGWEGERWLNTRSTNVRSIMTRRFDLAKSKRCDALEPDNVDGYQNSNGLGLTEADAIDYLRFMATEAHARGLSIGLKNALDIVPALVNDMDWALNEQCGQYSECDALLPFIEKNKAVFHCEYSSSAFSKVCSDPRFDRFSSILKTLNLTADPLTFCP